MSEPARKPNPAPESYSPKAKPEIVSLAQQAQAPRTKPVPFKDHLSEITLVDLPKRKVASYERISSNPEQESGEFIEAWIEKHGLRMASAAGRGDKGVIRYGFDCHKGRDICGENTECSKEPKGCWSCRIYHQYVTLPEGAPIVGDSDVEVKDFPGGKYARVAVRDPFSCDFPSAWYVLLKWAFKHKIPNRLGCKSKKGCYSLFSNEESPCLEEIYWEDGVQYMAMYLPVEFPESHSPKAKPEIVKLAGKINMNKAYTVKTGRGGAYISDVPRLKWGQWKDDTYSGALSLLLQIAGEDVSYEQVMGWSGSCYRICQKDDLCPSGALPQIGWVDGGNVDNAVGRKHYAAKRKRKRARMLMDSIRQGVPVLCGKPRVEDEFGIICGYRKKPFGRLVPYGRSYFDYEPPARDKIFTEDHYFHADMYPGWQLDFYAKKGDPIPPRQALKASLEACLKIYTQEPAEWAVPFGYKYGDAAYAVWIEKLANPEGIDEYDGKLHHHFRALVDARRAASVYLNQSCPLLRGANRERLAKAADLYGEMTQALLRVKEYQTAEGVMFIYAEHLPWSPADRALLAETLQQIRVWEAQARVNVQEILDAWEEDAT